MDTIILNSLSEISKGVDPVRNARITAAIVKRNKVIATASNLPKSHPMQKRWGKNSAAIYLHAEINAIRHASTIINDFSKCAIYVARIKANEGWGLAKPCSGCMNAIEFYNLAKVIYTTNITGHYETETLKEVENVLS